MSSPTRVVLLACGSFNPVTNMHLRMFELARDALNKTGRYRVIGGIISPVHDSYSKEDLVVAKHRCTMLRLALKSSDWIRLDTWECEQQTWSETRKVLHHHKSALDTACNANTDTPSKKRKMDSADIHSHNALQNELNANEGAVHLKLLCGADLLESFAVPNLWKADDIEEIVSQYGMVCITRIGANPEKFIYESDVLSKHQNNIHLVTEWIQNEISATKIRRSMRRGESVKYLVLDSVIDYIKAHNLYGAGDNKLLNYITPSPNRDDPDSDCPSDTTCLSPRVSYQTMHNSFISQSLDSTDSVTRHRGYRRHRDLNYDQELRRNRKDHYRRGDSFDSLDSDHSFFLKSPRSHSPNLPIKPSSNVKSPLSPIAAPAPSAVHSKPVTCMGADISGLMRRVKGMRLTLTPETCV